MRIISVHSTLTCPRCGYPLRGQNIQSLCPECGYSVAIAWAEKKSTFKATEAEMGVEFRTLSNCLTFRPFLVLIAVCGGSIAMASVGLCGIALIGSYQWWSGRLFNQCWTLAGGFTAEASHARWISRLGACSAIAGWFGALLALLVSTALIPFNTSGPLFAIAFAAGLGADFFAILLTLCFAKRAAARLVLWVGRASLALHAVAIPIIIVLVWQWNALPQGIGLEWIAFLTIAGFFVGTWLGRDALLRTSLIVEQLGFTETDSIGSEVGIETVEHQKQVATAPIETINTPIPIAEDSGDQAKIVHLERSIQPRVSPTPTPDQEDFEI